MMSCNPRATCISLLGRIDVRIGSCKSCIFAWYDIARRSFGKHEPPKAKPDVRYADEIFSLVSWQNIFITWCASIEKALQRLPISLAKPILSACQLLLTYFTISAVSRSVRINGASMLL